MQLLLLEYVYLILIILALVMPASKLRLAQNRIQAINVWTNLVFVFNGLVFMLLGLQLPSIVRQFGAVGLSSAIGYGLAISLVLIVNWLA